jgi:hypothetical protein
MPVEKSGEKPGAERFDNDATIPWYETTYVIEGSDLNTEVEAYAVSAIPMTRTGRAGELKRRGLTVRHIGHNVYEVDAFYDAGDDDWTYRVSVRGKLQRILAGYEKVNSYKHPSLNEDYEIPDHGALINLRADGKVEGIEIPVPCTFLTISKRFDAGTITPTFVDQLSEASFCTNQTAWPASGPFGGWEADRLLFLGAELSDGRYAPMEVDLNFELGKHIENETINEVTGINKKAHDVLWWEEGPKKTMQSLSGTKEDIARFAHVVRVYNRVSYQTIFGF